MIFFKESNSSERTKFKPQYLENEETHKCLNVQGNIFFGNILKLRKGMKKFQQLCYKLICYVNPFKAAGEGRGTVIAACRQVTRRKELVHDQVILDSWKVLRWKEHRKRKEVHF